MADRERLKLTVRNRYGTDLRPVEVVADPEDEDGLREHLRSIARDPHNIGQYSMEVENLTREWMPKTIVRTDS